MGLERPAPLPSRNPQALLAIQPLHTPKPLPDRRLPRTRRRTSSPTGCWGTPSWRSSSPTRPPARWTAPSSSRPRTPASRLRAAARSRQRTTIGVRWITSTAQFGTRRRMPRRSSSSRACSCACASCMRRAACSRVRSSGRGRSRGRAAGAARLRRWRSRPRRERRLEGFWRGATAGETAPPTLCPTTFCNRQEGSTPGHTSPRAPPLLVPRAGLRYSPRRQLPPAPARSLRPTSALPLTRSACCWAGCAARARTRAGAAAATAAAAPRAAAAAQRARRASGWWRCWRGSRSTTCGAGSWKRCGARGTSCFSTGGHDDEAEPWWHLAESRKVVCPPAARPDLPTPLPASRPRPPPPRPRRRTRRCLPRRLTTRPACSRSRASRSRSATSRPARRAASGCCEWSPRTRARRRCWQRSCSTRRAALAAEKGAAAGRRSSPFCHDPRPIVCVAEH
jgi:hypothetical protein